MVPFRFGVQLPIAASGAKMMDLGYSTLSTPVVAEGDGEAFAPVMARPAGH